MWTCVNWEGVGIRGNKLSGEGYWLPQNEDIRNQ